MYGSCAALSGESPDVWQNVSFWKQQSVFSLHWLVRTPSQSMSMSAFQNTAPVLPHTGIVADVSESVLYLPLKIWLQVVTLASRSAAVGAPPPDVPARSRSTLGPPLEVVAVARTLLVPALTAALTVTVAQVSQLPVGLNATPLAAGAPLTVMFIGRLAVLPLAWRNASVAVPAVAALTVHCT